MVVHTLAEEVMALDEEIAEIDKLIEGRFREHEHADVVLSVPGIGTVLGAEFLAADRRRHGRLRRPDRLWPASPASPPYPATPGKVSGNLHRPHRYHRRLQRVFYTLRAGQRPLRPELEDVLRPQAQPRGRSTSRPCSPSPADA